MSPPVRQPGDPPPPRHRRDTSAHDIGVEVSAQIAREYCDELRVDVDDLKIRVVQLEVSSADRSAAKRGRAPIVVTVVSAVGTLIVGIVLWALNFAADTKRSAVQQSTIGVDQKIDASKESAAAMYLRGVREGADAALERQKLEQDRQDLVIVPANTLKCRPPDRR